MPMHDWTRVKAGTYHNFHYRWVAAIMDRDPGRSGPLPDAFHETRKHFARPGDLACLCAVALRYCDVDIGPDVANRREPSCLSACCDEAAFIPSRRAAGPVPYSAVASLPSITSRIGLRSIKTPGVRTKTRPYSANGGMCP